MLMSGSITFQFMGARYEVVHKAPSEVLPEGSTHFKREDMAVPFLAVPGIVSFSSKRILKAIIAAYDAGVMSEELGTRDTTQAALLRSFETGVRRVQDTTSKD